MTPRALLTLTVFPDRYAISRLDAKADIPEWSAPGPFVSISRTPDELSIVCLEANIPSSMTCEAGWRVLKCEGPLDYALPGIMASIAEPLPTPAFRSFQSQPMTPITFWSKRR